MINIQNNDGNECFKLCLVGYLHPSDHNPRRIRKVDKDFARKLDFEDIKLEIEIFTKSKKKDCIGISVFGYENKQNYPIYVSKKLFQKTR